MHSLKLNIAINKEIDGIIKKAGEKLGTSKRNILSIALSKILNQRYTKEYIDKLAEDIHLDHATTFTINEHVALKLKSINRYGLAKRIFFGYLICDYFYKNYDVFISKDDMKKKFDTERDYVQVTIDKEIKKSISSYCEEYAISITSLFAHYIVNKEITINPIKNSIKIEETDLLQLTLSKYVKSILYQKKGAHISYNLYLNVIANQIVQDLL